MSATIRATTPDLRSELINWKERLESASAGEPNLELNGLLREVRSAIERLSAPESYGVCQVCHDLIDELRPARQELSELPDPATT